MRNTNPSRKLDPEGRHCIACRCGSISLPFCNRRCCGVLIGTILQALLRILFGFVPMRIDLFGHLIIAAPMQSVRPFLFGWAHTSKISQQEAHRRDAKFGQNHSRGCVRRKSGLASKCAGCEAEHLSAADRAGCLSDKERDDRAVDERDL